MKDSDKALAKIFPSAEARDIQICVLEATSGHLLVDLASNHVVVDKTAQAWATPARLNGIFGLLPIMD